jgi:[ribosomal protein S5]-alanine N-acetyltransferase
MALTPDFSPFPVLETEHFLLRRIILDDAPEIFDLRSNPELMQYIDRPLAETEKDARALIAKIDAALETNEGITWGIAAKETGRIMGSMGFWRLDKEHYRAEIGYMLHKSLQGKGLMREVMNVSLEYGFSNMNLHSIEANVKPGNEASVKLLEKTGFKQEAYFRENYYYNGHFYDSQIFSLLVSDFKPL